MWTVVARRIAAVLMLLVDGWALHATASLRTSLDVTDLEGWLRRTPPEEAVSAVVHVVAVALLGLVGAGFLVYWGATAFGLRRVARVAAWAVPRPLRYLVDGALAASVLVSAVPSSATGAAAHAVPVVAAAPAALSTTATAAERMHVVAPGEYLSLIAKRELGNANLWPELCQANRGIRQPDGRALEDCDLIRPRWNIRLVPKARANVSPAVERPQTAPLPVPAPALPSPESASSSLVPAMDAPSTHGPPGSSPARARTSEGGPESILPRLFLPAGGAGALAVAGRILRRRRCRTSNSSLASAISESLAARSATGFTTAGPCPMPVDQGETPNGSGPAEGADAFDPKVCPIVSFEGLGAEDAARGVVVEWLRHRAMSPSRVLIDSETLSLLFGDEITPLGFDVVATGAELVVRAEVERAHRMRLLEYEECEDADAYRSAPHAEMLEDLLVVSQVDHVHVGRWDALRATAPRLAVGLVLLGPCFDDGRHVVLETGEEWTTPMVRRQESAAALSAVLSSRLPTTSGFDSPAAPKDRDDGTQLFHVRLLGQPAIELSGLRIRKGLLDKSVETLAYLALNRDGVRREQLVEDLCSDVDIARQRPRINEAVSRLRRRLCEVVGRADIDVVVCEGDVYRLQDELFDVDLWRFEDSAHHVASCDDDERVEYLHRVVFSYRGEFASGVPWEWVEPIRETLRRRAIGFTYQLVDLAEQRGQVEEAIAAVEHAVDVIDPAAEDLYVRGVRLLVGVGRIEAARLLRQQLEARLDELNAGLRPENFSLLNSLLGTDLG